MSGAAHTLRLIGPPLAALSAHIRALAGDDDEAWMDTLDGETSAVGAARAVVQQINEASANAVTLKGLIATYSERKRAMEAREDRLRAALLRFLLDIGEKTLPLPEATVSWAMSQPGVVGEPDVDTLPEALVRVVREPNRLLIRAALAAGADVPGCSLSNAEPRLVLRVK